MPEPDGARVVRLQGLPDFNADDLNYVCDGFDGLFDAPAPRAVLVPNGSGPGAVPSGDWTPGEAPYLMTGFVRGDLATLANARRLLLAALPTGREVPVVFPGSGWDADLQIFVRRYDKASIPPPDLYLEFSIPLVAPDPYKYALAEVSGSMGVFSGASWQEKFARPAGTWVETFTKVGAVWAERYAQLAPAGPYPPAVTLTSAGDKTSARVKATVYGPLTAGDWYLLHEQTGRRAWLQAGVAAGQTATFDFRCWAASLQGGDVSHLLFGKPLTLQPGSNTYRLVSNTANAAAYATVSALPAYE